MLKDYKHLAYRDGKKGLLLQLRHELGSDRE